VESMLNFCSPYFVNSFPFGCLRRQRERDADDLEVEDMLADVACTAPAAAPAVPPEARSHLASVLGSYADDSNTCAVNTGNVLASGWGACADPDAVLVFALCQHCRLPPSSR